MGFISSDVSVCGIDLRRSQRGGNPASGKELFVEELASPSKPMRYRKHVQNRMGVLVDSTGLSKEISR